VTVAVKSDRDRRVAEVGAQGLGVQPGSDADTGEGVAPLVEAERFEAYLLPARVGAAAKDSGVGRPARVVRAWEEQAVAGMIEQDEMVGQECGELVDDWHAARLARLRGDELLGTAIPAPIDVNPAAIGIDGGDVERQQLAESQTRVDGEPERCPVLRPHRSDQPCRFGRGSDSLTNLLSGWESKAVAGIDADPPAQFREDDQGPQGRDNVSDRGRRSLRRHQPIDPALKFRPLEPGDLL